MADELTALGTVKTFNNLAKRATKTGSETLSLIWKAGETAKLAKESMPHGAWMPFVAKHYTVDHRSVTRWIKFHESIEESKLDTVSNLSAALKMIEAPKKKPAPGEEGTDSEGTEEPQEDDPLTSGEDTEEEGDSEEDQGYGECPNCGSVEWLEDEFGVSCTSCHHPHGEPAETNDKKAISNQRSKTIKTAEALQRAFGDLNDLLPKGTYDSAIKVATAAVQIAKGWK